MCYPPFGDIINVVVSGENGNEVKSVIINITRKLSEGLNQNDINYSLLGPTPAPLSKINNKFRWRFIVKCCTNEFVRELLRESVKASPKSDITVSLDINPNNMM